MIELWGGVNAPWSPWLLPGQGEYAFAGSGLAASVSGGRALAVSPGLVAIGTQAVLSLCIRESPGELWGS